MTDYPDTTEITNIHETNAGSVTQKLPERTHTLFPPDAEGTDWVYFVYSAGRIKIGYSRGVTARQKNLSGAGPFPPVLILVIPGTLTVEQDLHIRFADDRIHGEWFTLSEDIRTYLRPRLCDIGRDSLDAAEVAFRNYCEDFLACWRPIPKRPKRPLCEHGRPNGNMCAHCEREQGLRVLAELERSA